MAALGWLILGFLSGALPFSVWLGRALKGRDVRAYGDGNPGAANAWKAGGWALGFTVLALDYFKGALPVALAHYQYHLSGLELAAVGLAPVLGHAFSPFLRFRGGKAITVTFGVWTGLLLPAGPLVLGALQTALHYARVSRQWIPVLALLGLLAYLLAFVREPALLISWAGNVSVLMWKFRGELIPHMRKDLNVGQT